MIGWKITLRRILVRRVLSLCCATCNARIRLRSDGPEPDARFYRTSVIFRQKRPSCSTVGRTGILGCRPAKGEQLELAGKDVTRVTPLCYLDRTSSATVLRRLAYHTRGSSQKQESVKTGQKILRDAIHILYRPRSGFSLFLFKAEWDIKIEMNAE